jgi:hypothetical protein
MNGCRPATSGGRITTNCAGGGPGNHPGIERLVTLERTATSTFSAHSYGTSVSDGRRNGLISAAAPMRVHQLLTKLARSYDEIDGPSTTGCRPRPEPSNVFRRRAMTTISRHFCAAGT